MSQTVGEFFWHRIHEWGVHTVFGYPGDGINGLLGALNRANGQFRFIQTRHEEMAAFMASAYAKFTGEVGVCMVTSGPGASYGTVHSGVGYHAPLMVPHKQDLHRAAEVLNAGKKVAMLVGAGALRATDEVIAVAEKLGAGVAKALLGKAVVPDDLPWVTGSIGLLGTKPSWELMSNCDTLFMIGSGFPYSEFLPKEGQARAVSRSTSNRRC
jgi:thiamine pyrophosphate-dependent acetolactate synthase large subunit-like protein